MCASSGEDLSASGILLGFCNTIYNNSYGSTILGGHNNLI
jgi:hypothetical protein